MKTAETTYYEIEGSANTICTLKKVKDVIKRLQINTVIVASTTGATAVKAGEIIGKNVRIISVPLQLEQQAIWGAPTADNLQKCKELGIEFIPNNPKVMFIDTEKPDIANAWRVISRGFKVALQCASMCVDAGLIQEGSTVIALGGRINGADTAIVVEIFGYNNILKSNILEIIALPQQKYK